MLRRCKRSKHSSLRALSPRAIADMKPLVIARQLPKQPRANRCGGHPGLSLVKIIPRYQNGGAPYVVASGPRLLRQLPRNDKGVLDSKAFTKSGEKSRPQDISAGWGSRLSGPRPSFQAGM